MTRVLAGARVAVIHHPDSRHAPAWLRWLTDAGAQPTSISDDDTLAAARDVPFDLVVPLVLVKDVHQPDNPRMRALDWFHTTRPGLLLTPRSAVVDSADKLETALILRAAELPHPRTDKPRLYQWLPGQRHAVCKPRFSHSGRAVTLIGAGEVAGCDTVEPMVLQDLVEDVICLRVVCTTNRIVWAEEKRVPPGTLVANVATGAIPIPVQLDPELVDLSMRAVSAFGGGLLGLDLLTGPAGTVVLEGNVPFGFDDIPDFEQGILAALADRM